MNEIENLLKQAIVPPQNLKNEPILKLDYFEYISNITYQPILLRTLLNSINIFNYKYDINKNQAPDFPISIQKIKSIDQLHLIMHTKSNEDILNELLTKKMGLFPDISQDIIQKKIDIELEKDSYGKSQTQTHRNYLDGLLYERNCIKSFLSYFDEKDITLLPNIIFYIKKDFVVEVCTKLGMKSDEFIQIKSNDNREGIHFGYNEIDLLFKINRPKFIKDLKKDFTLMKAIDNLSLYDSKASLEKDKIYGLEVKVNSLDVNDRNITKAFNKSNILVNSLLEQGFLNNKNDSQNIIVIFIADYSKSIIEKHIMKSNITDIKNMIFFGDISINHTTLFSLNNKVEILKKENENIRADFKKISDELEFTKKDLAKLRGDFELFMKGANEKFNLIQNEKKNKEDRINVAEKKLYSLLGLQSINKSIKESIRKILFELID